MDVYIVLKSEPYSFEIFSDFDTAKKVFVNHLLTEWKKRCYKEGLSEQEASLSIRTNYQKIISKLNNFETTESYFFNADDICSHAFFVYLIKSKVYFSSK